MTLTIAASLVLSPIVWLDYYAVLAIPLAIVRPRLGPLWLLPLLTWGVRGAGAGIGDVSAILRILVVFGIVVLCAARAESRSRRGIGAAAGERVGATRAT